MTRIGRTGSVSPPIAADWWALVAGLAERVYWSPREMVELLVQAYQSERGMDLV